MWKHTNSKPQSISRRGLLAGAATVLPRSVLGGAGHTPPSDKITVACVGVGSQGLRVMMDYLAQPDVQIVSVCDVNKESSDYPQWSKNEYRDRVAKLFGGGYADWGAWLSPNQPVRLTRTKTVTSGTAGREPARKIVDGYYGSKHPSGRYRGCTAYRDFRELLEKENDVDAVIVCTPDHWHAVVSVAAMEKGKHVYCQKPMTHTIGEARRMAEVARRTGVATQVALFNQASEATRRLCEWISAGAIGPVYEVHNWSNRPVWPQGIERPAARQPVPQGLDWNLWLGPAPERPFHHAYLPFVWRGWHDFGCGAIGDMGCYSFDTIFRALKLGAPRSVVSSGSEMYPETYPIASIHHWRFAGRGDQPPVRLAWYDGGLKPPPPDELPAGESLEEEGLLFRGEDGVILCDFFGGKLRLLPRSRAKRFTPPPKTLPRSPGNDREWINACKGSKTVCGANFGFEATVTETLLLANIAQRTGGQLDWDSENLKTSNEAAAKLIDPPRRSPWSL